MCRNFVHKVPDLARPQCLINFAIYHNKLTVERIHLNPPEDTDKYPTPADQILAEQQSQEKRQRLPIEPNTADLQHSRFNRPTDKYGKPQPAESPRAASNRVTGGVKGPKRKTACESPKEIR